MTEDPPFRDDVELADAYALGLVDAQGLPDSFLARKRSGFERRLGKAGPIPWAVLPMSIVAHRAGPHEPPAFGSLEEYERDALRYIAIALEHGRAGISISMAVEANGYQPLYFEQALMLTDSVDDNPLWRAKDGSFVVTGKKVFGRDILSHAVDILDVCKETGIAPIPMSPDAPRKAKPKPKA